MVAVVAVAVVGELDEAAGRMRGTTRAANKWLTIFTSSIHLIGATEAKVPLCLYLFRTPLVANGFG